MATQVKSSTTPTPVATDVFNTPLLKADAKLAALETKLANAVTKAEREAIQEQIDARRSEVMQEQGFTNVGWSTGGSFIPGAGQGTGFEVLEPTGVPGIFTKSSIGTDTSVDPYGRTAVGNTGNLKTFYDENGNQLSPEEVAATPLGKAYAAKGWDIGYGNGNIGIDTPANDGTGPLGNGGSTTTKSLVSGTGSSTTGTTLKSDAQIAADTATAKATADRQSAYDLLYAEFSKYGLEALVTPLKGLITSGASPSEFTIKLRETPAYQQRFAGNAQRIANGLAAIDEATYIAKEDAYQNLMRNYGLPDTYWKKGPMGTQEGFTKLIANDVSAVELENRLQTAQQRVTKANPEVAYALKAFYPDITNGDILAYALDPKNALDAINRKVTAAEIGGAALAQGLTTSLGGAEGLAAYGITKNQAEQGYQTVAGILPRGSQLADIYGQQPYNQAVAEAEVFGTQGAAEAKRRREKLVSLETAQFGGSSGVGALGRDKAIYGSTSGQTGQF